MLNLKDNEHETKENLLKLSKERSFYDLHIHTHFSYCADDEMQPLEIIERAKMLGILGIALTDHAGQLYVSSEDYWSGNFVNKPDLIYENIDTEFNRMKKYKEYIKKYRSDYVLSGLEVEVNSNGNLVLLEEDRNDWDIILGAVHWIPEKYSQSIENGFMWANENLINNGIDILAHPFRYFVRKELKQPKELYRPLAKLLAENKVAAELNFHINSPDIDFFRICIEEGVKISLGSDAHEFFEIGCSSRYIDFLDEVCGINDWKQILYMPR